LEIYCIEIAAVFSDYHHHWKPLNQNGLMGIIVALLRTFDLFRE